MLKNIIKVIGGSMLLLASSSSAMTLIKGTNIVQATSSFDLGSSSLDSQISKIYGVSAFGAYKAYDPSSTSNFLKDIESGKNYIVILSSDVETADFSNGSSISESCVDLIKGTNIVQLPALTLGSTLNGADITKIYGVSAFGAYKAYDPSSSSNFLKTTEDGKSYIVITSSASTGTCDSNGTIENPPATPSLEDNSTSDALSTPPGVPSI